jgi:hypothetical protein
MSRAISIKTMEKHYGYRKLEPGHIRIFELFPATSRDAQVRCSILTTSMLLAPRYEAISYEWGCPKRIAKISTPEGCLKVYQSLYHALQALREQRRPRVLWADGISVNQEDPEEISEQFEIMDLVYESSRDDAGPIYGTIVSGGSHRPHNYKPFSITFFYDIKVCRV